MALTDLLSELNNLGALGSEEVVPVVPAVQEVPPVVAEEEEVEAAPADVEEAALLKQFSTDYSISDGEIEDETVEAAPTVAELPFDPEDVVARLRDLLRKVQSIKSVEDEIRSLIRALSGTA